MNLQLIIFYAFSALLLGSGLMVVTSKNPVRGVLFLILAFFASCILWLMLEAEFLALVLIFVYVGAVMTLFLFVVMMINPKVATKQEGFVKYLPLALLVMIALAGFMLFAVHTRLFDDTAFASLTLKPENYSNVKELGEVLYTEYAYAFEVAGAILLVAIISAISLAFRGRRKGTKSQIIADQVAVTKADRLTLVKVKGEKKS